MRSMFPSQKKCSREIYPPILTAPRANIGRRKPIKILLSLIICTMISKINVVLTKDNVLILSGKVTIWTFFPASVQLEYIFKRVSLYYAYSIMKSFNMLVSRNELHDIDVILFHKTLITEHIPIDFKII